MKAAEVQPGDEFRLADGKLVYVVEEFKALPKEDRVEALVRFHSDGGSAVRSWLPGDDIPLTRPGASSD